MAVSFWLLWRPAELVTVRFGPAPSSRDRIDDHRVRVGPWAVAITRAAIRGCCGDRGSGAVGRGRPPDIRRRSGRVGEAGAPTYAVPAAAPPTAAAPTAAPAAARRYWRRYTLLPTPATLVAVRGRPILASAVSRETFAGDQLNEAGTAAQTRAPPTETANRLSFFMIVSRLITRKLTGSRAPGHGINFRNLREPNKQLVILWRWPTAAAT
jgi:hypothetical protein